jgi:hypothetical protein
MILTASAPGFRRGRIFMTEYLFKKDASHIKIRIEWRRYQFLLLAAPARIGSQQCLYIELLS